MQIAVTQHNEGIEGGPEVWVRVLSNDYALTWQQVEDKLTQSQVDIIERLGKARKVVQYHPHMVTEEERAEHGYQTEEWWVWAPARPNAVDPILWNV